MGLYLSMKLEAGVSGCEMLELIGGLSVLFRDGRISPILAVVCPHNGLGCTPGSEVNVQSTVFVSSCNTV
jgi:hypothetical protein